MAKEISDAYNLAGEFLRVMVSTGNTVEVRGVDSGCGLVVIISGCNLIVIISGCG